MIKKEKNPSPYGTRVFEISDEESEASEESEGEEESEEESKKQESFSPRSFFLSEEQPSLAGFVDSSDDEDDQDSQGEMVNFFKTIIQRQMERFNSKQQGKLTEEELEAQQHLNDLNTEEELLQPIMTKSFLLTIHLTNIRPLIWRKVRVPAHLKLRNFHDKVISPAMGWCGAHAYFFRKIVYGPINSTAPDMKHRSMHGVNMVDDQEVRIAQILNKVGQKIEYLYDLKDQFRHKITLDSIEEGIPLSEIVVLDGSRACPPEDCGSPYKYAQKLQILKSGPSHKEYREIMREFQNADNFKDQNKFDPEYFDLKETNKKIASCWKIKRTGPPQSFDDLMALGQPTIFPPKKCALCGKESESKCGRCKLIYYCSKEHQLEHWAKHKAICGLLTTKQQ